MFESVAARKSRRINPVALLLVVGVAIGGFALFRWYEQRELDETYASLGLTSGPEAAVVPRNPTHVALPGMTVELRGPGERTGSDSDGKIVDMRGNGVFWWTPSAARQQQSIEELATDLAQVLLGAMRKREPAAQIVASRPTVVDGRPAHAFVARPTADGTTYLTATKCGSLLVQFLVVSGESDLAEMTSGFHCER